MEKKSLEGRTLYIPQMNYAGSRALAAVLRSIGVDATVSPDSDARTLELGGRYTSGDECYPEIVTLGNFLKVTRMEGFKPEETAFFMATAGGPCRFGQYSGFIEKVMRDLGYGDAMMFSLSSSDGYEGIKEQGNELTRVAWWAVVSSDILQKMLLKTRPYEINKGDTDTVFKEGIDKLCSVIEQKIPRKEKFATIIETLIEVRDRFRQVPIKFNPEFPLIGVVGEIFCRLNCFSNENLVLKIEEFGGEVWLSDITEWIWYTNNEQIKKLRKAGKRFSKSMLAAKIKTSIQRRDEHKLLEPFEEDLKGYEEPEDIEIMLDYSEPYLPCPPGAGGEMVLNVGRAIYLYEKGADGIVDISPFTCMNGIVSEALYPHISKTHENIPIRSFYFDGTQSDLDRDVGIFIELARNYKRKKSKVKTICEAF